MRVLFVAALLAAVAHAVVQPMPHYRYSQRILAISRQVESSGGFTLDPCTTDGDCVSTHFCQFEICIPKVEQSCTSCDDCPGFPNEVCASDPDAGVSCTSRNAVIAGSMPLVGCPDVNSGDPEPSSEPMMTSQPGLPFAATPSPDMDPPTSPSPDPLPGLPMATPIPSETPKPSESTEQTPPPGLPMAETPTPQPAPETVNPPAPDGVPFAETPSPSVESPTDSSDDTTPVPEASVSAEASSEPSPSPSVAAASASPTTDPVCIGVHHLEDMSRDKLVFGEHRESKVLCDVNESCATRGHIVVYEGRAMMMKSYCEVVGRCVEKTMFVNSPKFVKGLVVASKSKGLHFTALAARFESRIEEQALKLVVRMGL